MIEGNTCIYYHYTCKPSSQVMDVEVSHITFFLYIHCLTRWTPLGSIGCVHMHQRRFAMEGWGILLKFEMLWKKIAKDKQKTDKIGWTKCHASMLGFEHDITNLLGFIGS